MLIRLGTEGREELAHSPGDHLGIFPLNEEGLVTRIISRLVDVPTMDATVRLQRLQRDGEMGGLPSRLGFVWFVKMWCMIGVECGTGLGNAWKDVENLPPGSVRELLSRFLDISAPPSPGLLRVLASSASRDDEKERLLRLASVCVPLFVRCSSLFCFVE